MHTPKKDFGQISSHLLLLIAVRNRSKIKIRNLLRSKPEHMGSNAASTLIETHLMLLLNEDDCGELEFLCGLLKELGLEPPLVPKLLNELSFRLALREVDSGRWEKALGFMNRIRAETPQILHNRALLNQKMERYVEANNNWNLLLKNEKKPKPADPPEKKSAYAVALTYIGSNYLLEEHFEAAYPYFKEALDLTPDDPETLEALMTISDELGRPAETLRYARKLLDVDPENSECFFAISQALQRLGKTDELISLYERQLEKRPGQTFRVLMEKFLSLLYYQSAMTLRHSQPEKAREFLEKSMKVPIMAAEAAYLSGFFHQKDGEIRKAERDFEIAVEAAEDHLDQFLLATAFYEDGMEDRAFNLFEEIIACDCTESEDIFIDEIIPFLAENDDFDGVSRFCDSVAIGDDLLLYQIADQLLGLAKPHWARLYSSRLVDENTGVDADDLFLHLLILNKIGESAEAVEITEALLDDALQDDDQDSARNYRRIIKELKTRKRAKISYS